MRGELEEEREEEGESERERERVKSEMVGHPLFEKVLAAHVECLRVATPVDYLPIIDSQLAGRSSCGSSSHQAYHGNQELDHFLAQYAMILSSFKEELQNHVRVHALEAVMASWEIERSLVALTGEPLSVGTDATMSDEEETLQADSGQESSDTGQDMMGFGPLHPTESERTLMERVRKELKIELKQGFKSKIEDVREEIMRKRRAGKLPDDTTSVLKSWWEQHSKWPYPTEDDKAMLVEETGLQLKQINNWFINQRKRNWHGCSPSTTSLKPKNKR